MPFEILADKPQNYPFKRINKEFNKKTIK